MELNNQVVTLEKAVDEKTLEQNENSMIDFKMVTFSLSGKDYSIDIMHIKEIAKAGRFTYVPNTLPFVLGVYNLRGEIIPILDLRLFFNIEVPERVDGKMENLLILNIDDQRFGVVVDKIDKVIGVQKSTIQPPHPLFGDINIKYISGVVESNNRLYVLLDVTRIFSATSEAEEGKTVAIKYNPQIEQNKSEVKEVSPQKAAQPSFVVKEEPVAGGLSEADYNFLKQSLANYAKFYVSSVNESWVRHRATEWCSEKNSKNVQLQNEIETEEFLKPFWSKFTGKWWSKDFASEFEKALPENSAKQIIVWNPGCGKGTETYSLACVLKKKYPDAKIRIYAQDTDLLSVSNASLISIPSELVSDWYSPYLTKKANGDYTFSQEIKDSIMFEYHDCKNTNALPMVDIVFARDILSLLDEKSQENVVADFLEKMKGNAVAFVGDNETMPSSFGFGEKSVGNFVAYNKD